MITCHECNDDQSARRFTRTRDAISRRVPVISEHPDRKLIRALFFVGERCCVATITLDASPNRLSMQVPVKASAKTRESAARAIARETEFTRLISERDDCNGRLQAATVFDEGADPDVAAAAITRDFQTALGILDGEVER